MNPDEFPHFEIGFDEKGKFQGRAVNFDPYADRAVTVSILKKQLAEVEQLSSNRHQTDRVLTKLDKQKRDLETAIESFSETEPSPARTYPRREKRKAKAMLRKAPRADQRRK
jgi:hypothetical protein